MSLQVLVSPLHVFPLYLQFNNCLFVILFITIALIFTINQFLNNICLFVHLFIITITQKSYLFRKTAEAVDPSTIVQTVLLSGEVPERSRGVPLIQYLYIPRITEKPVTLLLR